MHAWLLTTQLIVAAGSGTARAIEHPSNAGLRCSATPVRAACPSITTRSRTRYAPSPSVRRTGCSPARSGPAAAPPPSRACSPPPNSIDLIRHAGWPTPLKNSLPDRKAGSTRWYRSQTLHRPRRRWKVGRPDAYARKCACPGNRAGRLDQGEMVAVDRHVGLRSNDYADVGPGQSRRVVDAIAGHCH